MLTSNRRARRRSQQKYAFAFAQPHRVANEFELPTDDYTLVNASVAVRPLAQQNVTLFAEARNLTDEEAREHVSFLKDIAPLPGRNLRVGVAYRF